MRKATLTLALLAILVQGCGGETEAGAETGKAPSETGMPNEPVKMPVDPDQTFEPVEEMPVSGEELPEPVEQMPPHNPETRP